MARESERPGTLRPSLQPVGAPAAGALKPTADQITRLTDQYFNKTKAVVRRFGDKSVTYAVFMRRPVVAALRLAVEWLNAIAAARGTGIEVEQRHEEGAFVGAGDPLLYITGSLVELVDLETIYLQKIGPPCVAAYNAREMCVALPRTAFLAMDARHCAGADMAEMMAYAAAVGSAAARREAGAIGFIGNATAATAFYFGDGEARGTMPHALVGYAGSTLRAAEMFHEVFPDQDMTVLVDYFGREISDSLEVCRHFRELAEVGRLALRLDTHGGRYIEGLDLARSYAVLDRQAPASIRSYRTEAEMRYLVGTGVSAAAIWRLREELDGAGFNKVRIVASSGFAPAKCRTVALANVPVDVIGTGSYLPEFWAETYATADIVAYDGETLVKLGREFLLRKR